MAVHPKSSLSVSAKVIVTTMTNVLVISFVISVDETMQFQDVLEEGKKETVLIFVFYHPLQVQLYHILHLNNLPFLLLQVCHLLHLIYHLSAPHNHPRWNHPLQSDFVSTGHVAQGGKNPAEKHTGASNAVPVRAGKTLPSK